MLSSLTAKLSILIGSAMGMIYLTARLIHNPVSAMVIGAATALLVSNLFISRYVTAPLDTLTQAMRLLEQGNSNAKIRINGSNQMRDLSHSFNLMVDRVMVLVDTTAQQVFDLAQAQERLQHTTVLQEINSELAKSLADVRLLNSRQEAVYMNTINALVSTIEANDPYTHGHSGRVTQYSMALASKISLPPERCKTLEKAAILHDIGKIGIDKTILHKQSALTNDEYSLMKQHPAIAVSILKNIEFLADVQESVAKHHERYDGKGYPYGVDGDDLPIEARIMSIADTFDAMTSHRPYRRGLSVEVAINELSANAGTQFDPILVDHFITMLRNGELLPIFDSRT